MEIFFCSHCNQSIPLKDVQSGAAELRRGKYLCVSCKEIELAAKRSVPGTGTLVLGILLVGSLAVIAFLLFEEDLFPKTEPAARIVKVSREDLLASVGKVEREVLAMKQANARDVAGVFDRVSERLRVTEQRLGTAIEKVERAGADAPAGPSADDIAALRRDVDGVASEVAAMNAMLRSMERTLAAVRAETEKLRETAVARPVVPTPKPTRKVDEIDKWIAALDAPVSGDRFNAVAELTRFKGERVNEALIGRLKDDDYFIRRFVAEELGERKVMAAARPLVVALDDDEVSVRESAVQALRTLTGKSFGYKSNASARDRARAKARWDTLITSLEKKRK